MNMSGGAIVWVLDADSGKFNEALLEAERRANSAGQSIDKELGGATDSATGKLKNFGRSLAGVGWSTFNIGVAGATTALGALITKGFSSGLQLQSLQIQMEGLTKSMSLGSKAMAAAYEYAKKAPFQLPEVAGTTKTLIAFGMSVDQAIGNLELLGNVSITSGVPLQSLAGIFGRVSAQGRVMGGDLQQLTENGISILPALQKALGKTADEVREMASDGEINFATFRKAMESIVDPSILERLNNTLPRQLDRLGGSVRILSGSLVGYTVDVNNGFKLMERSLIQSATTLVKNVADTLRAQPLLDAANRFGQTLSPYLDKINQLFAIEPGESMSKATEILTKFFNVLSDMGPLIIPLLGGLAISSTQFLQNVPLVGAALAPIGQAFNDTALGALNLLNPLNQFRGSSSGAIEAMGGISTAVSGTKGWFDQLTDGVGRGITQFQGIPSIFAPARDSISNFGSAIQNTGKNFLFASTAIPGVSSKLESMTGHWWNARDSVGGFMDKINPIDNIMGKARGGIDAVGGRLGFLGDAFGAVKGKAGLFGDLISPLTDLLPSFSSVLGAGGNALGIYGQALSGAGSALTSIMGIFGKAALAIGGVGLVFGAAAIGLGMLADSMGMNAEQMGQFIQKTVDNIIAGINGFLTKLPSILNGFAENINTYIPIIVNAITSLIEGIINSIATNGPAIVTAFTGLIETLATVFLGELPKLIQAGVAMISALVDGFINALPELISTATSIITMLIQTIGEELPKLLQAGADILLALVTGIQENMPAIIQGVTKAVTTFTKTLATMLPKIVETGLKLVDGLVQGIIENMPAILEATTTLITTIIDSLATLLPLLLKAGLQLLLGIVQGIVEALPTLIPAIVQMVTTIITALVEALPKLLTAGIEILMALIQGIVDNLPAIVEAINLLIETLLQALVDNLPMIIEGAVTLITTLAEAMGENLPTIIDAIIQIVLAIVKVLLDNLPLLIQAAIQIVVALAVGLIKALPQLIGAVGKLAGGILSALWEGVKGIGEIGVNIVKGIWNGISSMGSWLKDKVVSFVKDKIPEPIRKALGIHSPSKLFAGIGVNMMEGLAKGMLGQGDKLVKQSKSMADELADTFSTLDGSNAINYTASLQDNIPRDIQNLSRSVDTSYLGTDDAMEGAGRRVEIKQTNNVFTDIDMQQINRDLAWELAKA